MMLSRNGVNPRKLQEAVTAADCRILIKRPFCCVEFFVLNLDDTREGILTSNRCRLV
jgi:hypothetical protein